MIRTSVTISYGRRRSKLEAWYNKKFGCWVLVWARPTEHGHSYDKPIETGFLTKKAALERRKVILGNA